MTRSSSRWHANSSLLSFRRISTANHCRLPAWRIRLGLSGLFSLEAAEDGAVFALPEDFYTVEARAAQPLQLIVPGRARPIEVQKTAAGFDQQIALLVDALNDFWLAHVVNRNR